MIGGSRSTTPVSLGSRKSPTNDQGVQAGGAKRDDKKVIKPIQPPNQRNQQRKRSRERRDSHALLDPQVLIVFKYIQCVSKCLQFL